MLDIFFVSFFLKYIFLVVPVLLSVAVMTLAERKIMAAMQRRKGPNVIGIFGLLQPFADAAKLIFKETIFPVSSNYIIFVLSPVFTLMFSLLIWAIVPFNWGFFFTDLNLGILFIFAISSLGVYGIIMSGWSSNSKYSFLGALRSTAQMISYEVSIGLIVMCVLFCSGSLNLSWIVYTQFYGWYIFPLFPIFIMFLISALAETNRAPFDLPEAEGELVAGYFVEYSAAGFALFFIAEYANIIFMCSLLTIFFLGGWLPLVNLFFIPNEVWFACKIVIFVFIFIWVRASLPRYRYDQLMYLGWKVLLPISLSFIITVPSYLILRDSLNLVF